MSMTFRQQENSEQFNFVSKYHFTFSNYLKYVNTDILRTNQL